MRPACLPRGSPCVEGTGAAGVCIAEDSSIAKNLHRDQSSNTKPRGVRMALPPMATGEPRMPAPVFAKLLCFAGNLYFADEGWVSQGKLRRLPQRFGRESLSEP
jgi:hypothetical protein